MSRHDLLPAIAPLVERLCLDYCWVKPLGHHPSRISEPLTPERLAKHLNGGPACGAAPIRPGESTTRAAVLDLDSHGGESSWEEVLEAVTDVECELIERGMRPRSFRSSGGRGAHVYLLWDEPQDARSVRAMLTTALAARCYRVGTRGVKAGEVEVFPKQSSVAPDGFGSMFVLPLAGASAPIGSTGVLPREAALDMAWEASPPVPVLPPDERPAAPPAVVGPELASLRSALLAIPNGDGDSLDYDAWRSVVFGVHHATAGSDEGLVLAQEFSARSPKHDPDFLKRRVWPYVRSERGGAVVTARTVFDLARRAGWEEPVADHFDVVAPPAAPATVPAGRFRVEGVDEFCGRPAPDWIVHGVMPRSDLIVLFGEPGSGKSFAALDLAVAVARGAPWRGRRVQQGRVVYVCAEGAGGFTKRLLAYGQHSGVNLGDFAFGVVADAPNLLAQDDRHLAAAIAAWGGADLVVVDTFAQVTPGGDENSAEDVGRALGHLRRLRQATGATVLLVHHSGKDASKGARGWSGLKAAADAELEVTRADHQREVAVTKLKDGEDGQRFAFRLVPVDLGRDRHGDSVSSCVVEHVEEPVQRARPKPRGVKQQVLLRALEELAGLSGMAVRVPELIEAALRRLPQDGAKVFQARFTLRRAIESLIADGVVEVSDDAVRLVESGA